MERHLLERAVTGLQVKITIRILHLVKHSDRRENRLTKNNITDWGIEKAHGNPRAARAPSNHLLFCL